MGSMGGEGAVQAVPGPACSSSWVSSSGLTWWCQERQDAILGPFDPVSGAETVREPDTSRGPRAGLYMRNHALRHMVQQWAVEREGAVIMLGTVPYKECPRVSQVMRELVENSRRKNGGPAVPRSDPLGAEKQSLGLIFQRQWGVREGLQKHPLSWWTHPGLKAQF